ncbi:MAG: hypothetical protein PVG33_17700 [Chloroflexota bacterium]|jgi:hypothetical protein
MKVNSISKMVLLILILLALAAGSSAAQEPDESQPPRTDDASALSGDLPASVQAGNLVLLIQDQTPWADGVRAALANLSIAYDTITSSNLSATDLSGYFMIIVPSVQTNAYYNNWNKNLAKIEAYVRAGGLLWMSAANQAGQPEPLIPGGVVSSSDLEQYNDVVASSHPWVSGVPAAIGPYSYTSHDSFEPSSLYPDTLVVVRERTNSRPTLIDYRYGLGRIMVNGMTLEAFYGSGANHGLILENSLLNMVRGINLNVAGLSGTGNGQMSIGAVRDAVSWSLDVHTGGGNPVGTWNFILDWDCNEPNLGINVPSVPINANGTMGGAFAGASLEKDANHLFIRFGGGGAKYNGYIAGDNMGGIAFTQFGLLGCWEAFRVAADAGNSLHDLSENSAQIARGEVPEAEPAGPPSIGVDVAPDVSDWLTVTPGSGSLSANKRAAITLQTGAGFSANDNYGLVVIKSSDLDRSRIIAPVALAVANVPLSMNNVCGYRLDGRETEPNEDRGQANRFCLGMPVKGYPNNSYPGPEFDWYTFEWDGKGKVQLDLTNFVTDGQMILYKGNTELAKDFNKTHLQVLRSGAGAGTYYVLVTAGLSRPDPGVDYTLTATIK